MPDSTVRPAGYPVRIDVEPQRTGRDRLTVAFRPLLAIPHIILVGAPGFGMGFHAGTVSHGATVRRSVGLERGFRRGWQAMRHHTRAIVVVVAVVVTVSGGGCSRPRAEQDQAATAAARFEIRDVMIPTRDGTRLHTRIFTPKEQREALPFIMKRTPYGVEGAAGNFVTYLKDLADEGYLFVFQDIRGRYGSEGSFVMQRPARDPATPKAIDEGTDTYDTIEWLLKNVPRNNGRVGMLGVSYDGWTTVMATLEPHPALKAVSPQASPADMWLGDDFHHNGAFRLSYGFEYAAMMETSKENVDFAFDRYDTYEWYLALGPLSNVNARYLHGKIPTWNDYVAHPD